jgi:pilus assembly protein Flp/PilA
VNAIISLISRLTNREEGQTLTEYGLILAFIAIVVIIAATFLGDEISDLFSRVALRLQGAGN